MLEVLQACAIVGHRFDWKGGGGRGRREGRISETRWNDTTLENVGLRYEARMF